MADESVNVKVNTTADTKGVEQSTSSFLKLSGAVAAGQAIYSLASQAISKIGDTAKSVVSDTENLGKSTLQLQREMGISAESASGLLAVFNRFGVDTQGVSKDMGLFSKQIIAVADPAKYAGSIFDDLGVKVLGTNGTLRTADQVMLDVADRFKELPNGVQKTTDAMKLFGRSGKDMIPILNLGSSGIQELEQKAAQMGLVLTQNNVESIRKLIIAQKDWHEETEGIKIQLGEAIIPKLTEAATVITSNFIPAVRDISKFLKPFGEDLIGVGKGLEDAGEKAGQFLTPSFVALFNAIKQLIPPLETLWKRYIAPLIPILGSALVVAIMLVVNQWRIMIEILTKVTNLIVNHRVALVAVAGALAVLAAVWLTTAIPAAIAWAAAGVSAGIAWLVAAAPMLAIVAVGAALAAVAYEIIAHWSNVKQWFFDALNWFKAHWGDLVAILFGPFGIAVDLIIRNWGRITDFFVGLKNTVLGLVSDAGNWLYNVGKSIIQGMINGIKDAVGGIGGALGKVGSDIGNSVKGALHAIHIPGFASGVSNFSGGLAVVGEQGPELAYLPSGSSVIPAKQTASILGGGGGGRQQTVTIGNVFLGSSAAAQTFFDNLDQDTINVRRGLTANRGS